MIKPFLYFLATATLVSSNPQNLSTRVVFSDAEVPYYYVVTKEGKKQLLIFKDKSSTDVSNNSRKKLFKQE